MSYFQIQTTRQHKWLCRKLHLDLEWGNSLVQTKVRLQIQLDGVGRWCLPAGWHWLGRRTKNDAVLLAMRNLMRFGQIVCVLVHLEIPFSACKRHLESYFIHFEADFAKCKISSRIRYFVLRTVLSIKKAADSCFSTKMWHLSEFAKSWWKRGLAALNRCGTAGCMTIDERVFWLRRESASALAVPPGPACTSSALADRLAIHSSINPGFYSDCWMAIASCFIKVLHNHCLCERRRQCLPKRKIITAQQVMKSFNLPHTLKRVYGREITTTTSAVGRLDAIEMPLEINAWFCFSAAVCQGKLVTYR